MSLSSRLSDASVGSLFHIPDRATSSRLSFRPSTVSNATTTNAAADTTLTSVTAATNTASSDTHTTATTTGVLGEGLATSATSSTASCEVQPAVSTTTTTSGGSSSSNATSSCRAVCLNLGLILGVAAFFSSSAFGYSHLLLALPWTTTTSNTITTSTSSIAASSISASTTDITTSGISTTTRESSSDASSPPTASPVSGSTPSSSSSTGDASSDISRTHHSSSITSFTTGSSISSVFSAGSYYGNTTSSMILIPNLDAMAFLWPMMILWFAAADSVAIFIAFSSSATVATNNTATTTTTTTKSLILGIVSWLLPVVLVYWLLTVILVVVGVPVGKLWLDLILAGVAFWAIAFIAVWRVIVVRDRSPEAAAMRAQLVADGVRLLPPWRRALKGMGTTVLAVGPAFAYLMAVRPLFSVYDSKWWQLGVFVFAFVYQGGR